MLGTKFNRYDILLTGIFFSLLFGMLGGGAQPIRILFVGLAPFMIIDALRRPSASLAYYRYEVFFLVFWWMFSLGFLYKAMEMSESVKHLAFLLIHIIGFLEVLWLANKAKRPQRAIFWGWILMLLCTIPIGAWEFNSGQHLGTTIMDDQTIVFGTTRIERPFAAITFGNLNSYNTTICWAMPFLFTYMLFSEKKYDTYVCICTMAPLFLLVILNSSRGSIISMSALIVLYIGCYMKVGKHKTIMMTFVTIIVLILAYYLYEMFFFIIGRFEDQGFEDDGRMENIVKGIQAFFDSGGLGIGIGNYEPVMLQTYNVLIPAPHNIFLEVFVVWGIFVTIGLLGMLVKSYQRMKCGELRNKMFFIFGIVCLFLGGIVDSGYWMKATTWMFLAGFYVFCDARYNRKEIDVKQ